MALSDTIALQDCNLIAEAFERGAAHDSSEASVYAPLSRNVQNNRTFATGAQQILSSFSPQIISNQPEAFQGIKLENQFIPIPGASAGTILSRAIKNCIPCKFRLLSAIDLNIGNNLLESLKADVKRRLGILNKISDLFSNVDIYGDYCNMISFLNFMCVPDLQRMIAILASLLTDFARSLIQLNGLLQALITPFFTPVLLSMQVLMNQFVQLVLSPINCIMTSIQENIRKINIGAGDNTLTGVSRNIEVAKQKSRLEANKIQGHVRSGLVELGNMLEQGNNLIRSKLDFYFKQLDKLLSSTGINHLNSVGVANNKLVVVRLIALIKAIIKVNNQGTKLCQEGQKPGPTELDNFFNTFIGPQSPFDISVDPDGNLRIEEKPKDKVNPTTIEVSGKKLLFFAPVSKTFGCGLATSQDDIDKVNKWISELNTV